MVLQKVNAKVIQVTKVILQIIIHNDIYTSYSEYFGKTSGVLLGSLA